MITLYGALKLVHVLAVVVWVGGGIALTVLNARMRRFPDPAARIAFADLNVFYGRAVLGPAGGFAFLGGVALVARSAWSFSAPWVVWGLLVLVASMYLGAVPTRKTAEEMARITAAAQPDPARIAALQRRFAVLAWVNLALLVSAIAAMVLKPTF